MDVEQMVHMLTTVHGEVNLPSFFYIFSQNLNAINSRM
jgi:hypothetical protein